MQVVQCMSLHDQELSSVVLREHNCRFAKALMWRHWGTLISDWLITGGFKEVEEQVDSWILCPERDTSLYILSDAEICKQSSDWWRKWRQR